MYFSALRERRAAVIVRFFYKGVSFVYNLRRPARQISNQDHSLAALIRLISAQSCSLFARLGNFDKQNSLNVAFY